ncbi:MAG: SEL1-like repeat protein [Rhodospirillaceae bacterium]|nr:SEL1-like repeat protein [Rhodospirillaceae bacterium]
MKRLLILLIVLAAAGGWWFATSEPPKPIPAHIQKLKADAQAGDVRAEYGLGRVYQLGDGLPKNLGMAIPLLKKAANKIQLPIFSP